MGVDRQLPTLSSPAAFEPHALRFLPQIPLAKHHSTETVQIREKKKSANKLAKSLCLRCVSKRGSNAVLKESSQN